MVQKVSNDIQKTVEKILKYEQIYQKNSVECYFEFGEKEKYPKEWMDLFEKYYHSKCDLTKINSISPLKKITIVGEDTQKIKDVLMEVERFSIIQISSSNTKLKMYENICEVNNLFLKIYSNKKLKGKFLHNVFNEVCENPKKEILKNTDELVLLNELESYDFIEKFKIKNVRLFFQEEH